MLIDVYAKQKCPKCELPIDVRITIVETQRYIWKQGCNGSRGKYVLELDRQVDRAQLVCPHCEKLFPLLHWDLISDGKVTAG